MRNKREIDTLKNLEHKNIIQIFDFDIVDEKIFITIMEFCDYTFTEYLKEKKNLSFKTKVDLISQIG